MKCIPIFVAAGFIAVLSLAVFGQSPPADKWQTIEYEIGAVVLTGDIVRPSEYTIPADGLTLSQLIASAGGISDEANRAAIQIRRAKSDTEVAYMEVLYPSPPDQSVFRLEPNDVVTVRAILEDS